MKIKVPIGRAKIEGPFEVVQITTDDFVIYAKKVSVDYDVESGVLHGTMSAVDLYGVDFTWSVTKLKKSIPFCATQVYQNKKLFYICYKPQMYIEDNRWIVGLPVIQNSKEGNWEHVVTYYNEHSF